MPVDPTNSAASPDIPIDLQVQRRLVDIGRLVSLPQTTFRLLSLLMEERTSAKDLQAVVESDPALTAKIISLSNSAVYSPREPVSNVQRAITIIGFNELEILAMGVGLSETFDLRTVPAGFDSTALWMHCLAVSWICRELAESCGACDPGEAMISGILHELGTLILISKFPVHFQQLLDLINSGMSLRKAETVLSLRHEVIGYHLARNWGLPQIFQEVILYHHDPKEAGLFRTEASLVALADNLAHRSGFDMRLESLEINLPDVLHTLGLQVDQLQQVVKRIIESVGKVEPVWQQIIRQSARTEPKRNSLSSLLNRK
jgi:HD-like signal output (HDOD) protein